MIYLCLNFFYEACNTIKLTLSRTNSLPLIDSSNPSWCLWLRFKKFFNNFICFMNHHSLYVVTLCTHSTSFFRFFWRKELIAIVNKIFHLPWVFLSIIISLKYGLIILRYSLVASTLLLSPILSYSI